MDWNPYGFSADDPQINTDPDVCELDVFNEDKSIPSVGITYMGDLWAETFQLRSGLQRDSGATGPARNYRLELHRPDHR